MMNNEFHIPVLIDEVLKYLHPVKDGIYVDCTLGGGGHARNILQGLSNKSKLIGFDIDAEAISKARCNLIDYKDQLVLIQDNFINLRERLNDLNVELIQGFLLDLGVSSYQIDSGYRGFSFQSDNRIDMRMDKTQSLDGWNVVNKYEIERLTDIFRKYGEEINSRRIAKKIIDVRNIKSIDTTRELADVIESAVGKKFLIKTLARIFQAIRIEVNNELQNLQHVLHNVIEILDKGSRIVVISYHSLEDRIVKQCFRNESMNRLHNKNKMLPDIMLKPNLKVLTKKPVRAKEEEVKCNQRARSAKLRAAERI